MDISKLDKSLESFAAAKASGGGSSNFHVRMTATLKCSMGLAPSKLIVLPINMVITEGTPGANIMDHKPMVNILPFGMCKSLANPTVAAATAAAMGALTPMPCIPMTMSPWIVGAPTVLLANQPALDNVSKCMCTWAGVIEISDPAVTKTNIP